MVPAHLVWSRHQWKLWIQATSPGWIPKIHYNFISKKTSLQRQPNDRNKNHRCKSLSNLPQEPIWFRANDLLSLETVAAKAFYGKVGRYLGSDKAPAVSFTTTLEVDVTSFGRHYAENECQNEPYWKGSSCSGAFEIHGLIMVGSINFDIVSFIHTLIANA